MRFEILLIIIVGFLMYNIYSDGKLIQKLYSYKKYGKMALVGFGGLVLYVLFKHHPERAKNMIENHNEYLKYMPFDSSTSAVISPILDFTKKSSYFRQQQEQMEGEYGYNHPILPMNSAEQRLLNSGKKGTKRSVSETKKKYVASNQDWKCFKCGRKLPAWFEVDHKIRLEYGGSNHVDNLVALCRDCHGEKTAMENL